MNVFVNYQGQQRLGGRRGGRLPEPGQRAVRQLAAVAAAGRQHHADGATRCGWRCGGDRTAAHADRVDADDGRDSGRQDDGPAVAHRQAGGDPVDGHAAAERSGWFPKTVVFHVYAISCVQWFLYVIFLYL